MTRNPVLFGMVHLRSSGHYTKVTLESFFKHTKLDDKDSFIIIDNDLSFSDVGFKHEKIKVITNKTPLPFSKNANFLMAQALDHKQDIFLLNNDIIFSKDWFLPFESPIRAIRLPVSNAQYQYKKNKLNLQMSMKLEDYLGSERELEEIADSHVMHHQGMKLVHTAPYYCVNIPYSVLSAVGFFDEQFVPAGWEDTDYSVRSYIENIPIYYVLNSYVLHFYGKSTWSVDNEIPSKVPKDIESAKLFEKKWGLNVARLFGYQSPELLTYMEERLQRASILEIGKMIQSLRTM